MPLRSVGQTSSLPYGCGAGDIEAPVRFSPYEHGVMIGASRRLAPTKATVGVGWNDGCRARVDRSRTACRAATRRPGTPQAAAAWVNAPERVWCLRSVGFQPDAKVTGRVLAPDWPPSTGLRTRPSTLLRTGFDTTSGLSFVKLRTRLRVHPALRMGKPAEAG
jgi:hypothetical protein